jgi:N-acetylglucosamine kinase-like BadF-type ATPase
MTNYYSGWKAQPLQPSASPELQMGGQSYFLGIDGGGTRTRAVIADSSLNRLGEAASGASNPLRAGLGEAVSHIRSAVNEACLQAGIDRGQITAACVALGGIGHPIHFHIMKKALDRALGIQHLQLVTDADAALAGALDGQAGVVIIAGTGSIAMGMNPEGEQARSGGWGPTLGDEGSGYDIARRALKAVAASFDGRSPQTLLTSIICDRLGISDPADLPGVIYNSDEERVEIASLAESVALAAGQGDEVAREILAEAGRELGALVVSVIEKLRMQHQQFRVACVGSVFNAGEAVIAPLRDAVLKVAPCAEVGEPLYPPTVGALKIAHQLEEKEKEKK